MDRWHLLFLGVLPVKPDSAEYHNLLEATDACILLGPILHTERMAYRLTVGKRFGFPTT